MALIVFSYLLLLLMLLLFYLLEKAVEEGEIEDRKREDSNEGKEGREKERTVKYSPLVHSSSIYSGWNWARLRARIGSSVEIYHMDCRDPHT